MSDVLPGDEVLADHMIDHETRIDALEAKVRYARKTSDETVNNSSTLQNDDALLISVAASTVYEIELLILYNSGTTPDFKFGFTYPTGLTMKYSVQAQSGGTALGFVQIQSSVPNIDGHAIDEGALVKGVVIVSSTAGTLQFQWAQNAATGSDTKVLSGSYLKLTKIS